MAVVETIRIEGETSGIENKIQKLNNQVEGLVDSIEDVGTESKKSFDKMDKESKETTKTVKKTDNAIKGFIKNIKGAAIAAGAIAIAKGVFQQTQFAIDKVNTAMLTLTGLFNNLDVFMATGGNVFEYFKIVEAAAERLVKSDKASLTAEVERQKIQLQSQKTIEVQRQIRDDITRGVEERRAANKEIARLTDEQIDKEKEQIEIQIKSAQLRFQVTKLHTDDVALQQKKLQLEELSERTTSVNSERLANENSLLNEGIALRQQKNSDDAEAIRLTGALLDRHVAIADVNLDQVEILERTNQTKRLKRELDFFDKSMLQLLRFNNERLIELQRTGQTENAEYETLLKERFDLEQQYAQESTQMQNDLFNSRIDSIAGGFDLAGQSATAFSNLSQALGENDEANAEKSFQRTKKFQLAAAIANTASAVTAQLANVPDVAGGLNFVKAGIALTTGLAQIATIKNTKFEAPDSLSRPSAGTNITAPSQAAQFNIVGQSGTNQLLEGIAGTFDRPVRAYVVAGEVLSGSQLDRQRLRTATFP
tara:strand:+ start:20353 stop:21966 length:1614 start_codon:yes stop_codon:yes gene_type:complete